MTRACGSRRRGLWALALLLVLSWPVWVAAQTVQVDPALPSYQAVQGVSGTLSSVGSDTMVNLVTLWAEGFNKYYPNVKVQIEGKGSSTAPPALAAGTAQFGPMSRLMKSNEQDAFEKKYGFKPTRLSAALDGLAVYVNKDNPLQELTLAQLDALFSKTRKHGYPRAITTWGDLGLRGDWATRRLSLYGRNSASGTYGYFKEVALKNGDYKDEVKEQPGSASVVQGITEDRNGLGYSGIGYRTSGVKALAIAKKEGAKAYPPTSEMVVKGAYPISRYLNIYLVKDPNRELDVLRREFLKFVFSKEGQLVVVKDGYLPVSAKTAAKELKKIGVEGAM